MKKAVVLLSGGLDSATTLYIAKSLGFKAYCLIFDYGQRHRREIGSAKAVAKRAESPFRVIKICLPWKGSALLDEAIKIHTASKPSRPSVLSKRIPLTYVPARNTIFLSFALSYAEAIGSRDIFIGANSIDYSGYPDCRPKYYRVFNRLSMLATKSGVLGRTIKIHAPLIRLNKSQIIKRGVRLGVPYKSTWSCYRGGKTPCGLCDSCILRAKGFREAELSDPALCKRQK